MNPGKVTLVVCLGLFAVAACTSDSGEATADAANPCAADAANPCAADVANPCAEDTAENPCAAEVEAPGRAPMAEVAEAIAAFVENDPSMQAWFDDAAGFVVFPGIGKGGFVVGGAHGNGEVIVAGSAVGTAEMTEVSIGAQAGGQEFREVIFFESEAEAEAFQAGGWELGGGASAVLVKSGASDRTKYSDGVAIFTLPTAGLMAEISVGGQKFSYEAY